MQLFITIILDGVGIGEQPDSVQYGDVGSDTLGHVCIYRHVVIPNLTRLGLGRIKPLEGIEAVSDPTASFGKMLEMSAGKDSTTGHWELAGLSLDHPFPTYPNGFPNEVIESFLENTDCSGVLGNKAISGTTIVAELGEEHAVTGYPIVYTSADSVFQIAAHVDVIPVEAL
ncbi:MAG: phosphopentomutase, partial [Bacteroidetes bacterium]|nr:phosphopentomutase [Bacteroidota bacterium]